MYRYLLPFAMTLFWACQPAAETTAPRPNIVLIVSDDHGSGDLGCYGNTAIHTPNLDALAAEGIRFDEAYCTSASCTASRSVLLSGLYNHANGLYGHMHHFHHFAAYDHIQTLPVLLEELGGYATARVGKYHLAPEAIYRFQENLPGNQRNAAEMARNSREFIRKHTDRPFFLYFCTSDPHRSGENHPGPLGANRFGNTEAGYPGIEERVFSPDEVMVPAYLPDNQYSRAELAEYYQSVARMDQGIGRLFEELKNAGVWDHTLIVYLSDNGIAFAGAKTTVYQPGIHLPLIVKTPSGTAAGAVSQQRVNWADITPTLLDMAGILPQAKEALATQYATTAQNWDNTANAEFHGQSFTAALKPGAPADNREVYASHTFHEITMYYPMRSVITDRFKLIWNIAWPLPYPHASDLWSSSTWQSALQSPNQQYGPRTVEAYTHRPEFELYDLQADPYERQNLAAAPQWQDTLAAMQARLQAFQNRTNDPWRGKWVYE